MKEKLTKIFEYASRLKMIESTTESEKGDARRG